MQVVFSVDAMAKKLDLKSPNYSCLMWYHGTKFPQFAVMLVIALK